MKQSFLLLTIVAFLFTGCENNSSSGNVTIKYEIESTSAFSPVFLNGVEIFPALFVGYINETGQGQAEVINTNTLTWSKTIQLTATQRPIQIHFTTTAYTATASGTGVLRVYVNGDLVAFQNIQIIPSTLQGGGFTGATGTFRGVIDYFIL